METEKLKELSKSKTPHQGQGDIEYLIIGQGICGTFLSWYLQKENKSFVVIDNYSSASASRVAAGIINPVTGRRIVHAWMIEELLPFAWNIYNAIGNELGIKAISQKNIIDFFTTSQMMLAFQQRLKEVKMYLHSCNDPGQYNTFFNYDFGCGQISPAYIVHLENLLPAWRNKLKESQQLLEENFRIEDLQVSDTVKYKSINANKIIFCDGIGSYRNPWFSQLPFAPNKGEILIIKAPDLLHNHIFKKGIMIAPLEEPDHFWVGSNYLWSFADENITEEFRTKSESQLKEWLKIPFKIVDHKASIRPASIERRPFAGLHPTQKNIGILNGMGTKGCSLAPFFAKQLTDYLLHQVPILPEADVKRFQKILTRSG